MELEREVLAAPQLAAGLLRRLKGYGFGDARLGELTGRSELEVRALRRGALAAPMPQALGALTATTTPPRLFSAYGEGEVPLLEPSGREHVLILGAGAGLEGLRGEYDEDCAHVVRAARALGYETTVIDSTLVPLSGGEGAPDRFFLEPVALEEILDLVVLERPKGVIARFAGGGPAGLAEALEALDVPLLGTAASSFALLDDPVERGAFLARLGVAALERPPAQGASPAPRAFPPGELLGGDVVFDALLLADGEGGAELIGIAEEFDVLALRIDDAARVTPPLSLGGSVLERVRDLTVRLTSALRVRGALAVRFVSREGRLFVLDVDLSAPRLVRLLGKAMEVELVEVITRLLLGVSLRDALPGIRRSGRVAVEIAAASRPREQSRDSHKDCRVSTAGRAIATAVSLPAALERALVLAGTPLPSAGEVFLSVQDREWPLLALLAGRLHALGFTLVATRGTATALSRFGVPAEVIELGEDAAASVPAMIERGDFAVALVTPPPSRRGAVSACSAAWRTVAVRCFSPRSPPPPRSSPRLRPPRAPSRRRPPVCPNSPSIGRTNARLDYDGCSAAASGDLLLPGARHMPARLLLRA